jgi:ArsR family transcriptional regulator, virulence genes transcriptional regulator
MPAATTTPKASPAPQVRWAAPPAVQATAPELDRAGAMQAARFLHMAADPNRLQILLLLAGGPRNVGQLCVDLGGLTQPACSHHTGLLRNSSLISPNRVGRRIYYELTDRGRRLAGVIRAVAGAGGEEG